MRLANFFEKLRLFGYGLLIATYMIFNYTQYAVANNLVSNGDLFRYSAFIILIFCLFFQKYSIKEISIIIPIVFLGVYVSYMNRSLDVLITIFMIFSLKNVSFNKIVATDFFVRFSLMVTFFLLSLMGEIPSNNIYRSGSVLFLRQSYGFYHPNLFGAMLMIVTFEFIYLEYIKKRNNLTVWVIVPVVIFLEGTVNARSAELSLIIYLIVFNFLKTDFQKMISLKTYKIIAAGCISLAAFVSIWSSYMYNPTKNFWIDIDRLLSGRPHLLNSIVNSFYPIKIFGQRTIMLGNTDGSLVNGKQIYLFADNSYMIILIKFGIIAFIVFYLWFIKNSFSFIKGENKIIMLSWLIAMTFWGISENKLILIQFNILLFRYIENKYGKDKSSESLDNFT